MSETQRNCGNCMHGDVDGQTGPCGVCVYNGGRRDNWEAEPRADAYAAAQEAAGATNAARKHSHYFKDVSSLKTVDVYRVLELFDVTNPAIAHAAKKLLCAGRRGAKDQAKDIAEAIDTLTRWQEMRAEDVPYATKSCNTCARESDGTCGDMACIELSRWMPRAEGSS